MGRASFFVDTVHTKACAERSNVETTYSVRNRRVRDAGAKKRDYGPKRVLSLGIQERLFFALVEQMLRELCAPES